jgi:hypothetical protein
LFTAENAESAENAEEPLAVYWDAEEMEKDREETED